MALSKRTRPERGRVHHAEISLQQRRIRGAHEPDEMRANPSVRLQIGIILDKNRHADPHEATAVGARPDDQGAAVATLGELHQVAKR